VSQLDIIVIGASAGGLEPLLEIVAGVPVELPASIFITVHTAADGDTRLADILARRSRIPVAFAKHQEPLIGGRIYVAPPDVHLLVTPVGLTLNHGPRQNGFRPAIDPMFKSAARVYGNRSMGVILSGALDDGTYGLKLIKEAGGTAVVQDPDEATVSAMPLSAIRYVAVDHVLPARAIAELIASWAASGPGKGGVVATRKESDPIDDDSETVADMNSEFGPPSGITCPDCGGALWEIKDGKPVRYRCHVGHQFSSEGLDAAQRDAVETALWTAVRVLEEHADLRLRMSRRADMSGLQAVATSFADTARESHIQAQTLRDLLVSREPEHIPAPVPRKRARRRSAAKAPRRHGRR